jgi:DNA replication protein DnaC
MKFMGPGIGNANALFFAGRMSAEHQPFSKWESIFRDPMTTAAAIDRLVHHSIILALNVPSFRLELASSS